MLLITVFWSTDEIMAPVRVTFSQAAENVLLRNTAESNRQEVASVRETMKHAPTPTYAHGLAATSKERSTRAATCVARLFTSHALLPKSNFHTNRCIARAVGRATACVTKRW